MIYHNKGFCGNFREQTAIIKLAVIGLFFISAVTLLPHAGELSINQFSPFTDTISIRINSSGISLSSGYSCLIPGLDSDTLTIGRASYSSDVAARGSTGLSFFWAESLGGAIPNMLVTKSFAVNDSDISVIRCDTLKRRPIFSVNYLNASTLSDTNAYCVSLGQPESVLVSTRRDSASILNCKANNSSCAGIGNTFLVTYKQNNNLLRLRTYSYNPGTERLTQTGDRLTGDNTNDNLGVFTNSSIASDAQGKIFITMTRGASTSPKNLYYKYLDNNYICLDSNSLVTNVSSSSSTVDYADAPVISLASDVFAGVYWKQDESSIHLFIYRGVYPAWDTIIATGANLRSPAIAKNSKEVVVIWKNGGITGGTIEGKRIPHVNGVLSAIPDTTYRLSDLSDTRTPELNVAINDSAAIGITWRQGSHAFAKVWSNRQIIKSTGTWISPVESVNVSFADSLYYKPSVITQTLKNGTISGFLRAGPQADTNYGWSAWIPCTSSTALAQNTKGFNRYFQCKINIGRNASDSIHSPKVSQIRFLWECKPSLDNIDSFRVRGKGKIPYVNFDSTVDVVTGMDTMDLFMTLHDNDTEDTIVAASSWGETGSRIKDTISSASVIRYARLSFNPASVEDTIYSVNFSAADSRAWGSAPRRLNIRARKNRPVIASLSIDGKQYLANQKVLTTVGKQTDLRILLQKPDPPSWNPTSFSVYIPGVDTVHTDSVHLTFVPNKTCSSLTVVSTDRFGGADTCRVLLRFPYFPTDSIANQGFCSVKRVLADSLRYIIGNSHKKDTFRISVVNTGNDTLRIDSMRFHGAVTGWFKLGVPQGVSYVVFDSLTYSSGIQPVSIPPLDTQYLFCYLNTSLLSGDSVLTDTLILRTNDPLRGEELLPIRLVCRELPVISSMIGIFNSTVPYWEDTVAFLARTGQYRFPPQTAICLTFSEPVDTASTRDMVFCYSVWDSAAQGRIDTIQFKRAWNKKFTQVRLRPIYTKPSLFFKGLLPPRQYYIPTDSLTLCIGGKIRDRADTLLFGKNYLDVNHDYTLNDSARWILNGFRVDSIHFTIDSVFPAAQMTKAPTDKPFVLTFSSPLYPGTIDTSRYNNRSLVVSSKYFSGARGTNIVFDSVYCMDNKAYFKPAKRFFFNDSVTCRYRGSTGRDILGFSIDQNKDGIPMNFIDSISREEDVTWSFQVIGLDHDSIYPAPNARNIPRTAGIKLFFAQSLPAGVIDTSTVQNRSLYLRSRYSQNTTIGFDSVRVSSNTACFYPKHPFFYLDSAWCDFSGLSTNDTGQFSIHPGIGFVSTQKTIRWSFMIESLKVVSVYPESAKSNAAVRDYISLRFSGPLTPAIFDTSVDAVNNKSIRVVTSYSGGDPVPFSSITISADSTLVRILPSKAFFNYDSIACTFRGFKRNYSYLQPGSLLPDDTSELICGYNWYFLTGNDGFYTYPNPYKPGSDSRHRSMGGIWFKNLHSISGKGTLHDVVIRIYSINTDCIFESGQIHFEEGNKDKKPEWFWDTRNRRGSPVATGLYLYALFDISGKILLKGKLLIVR